MIKPLRVGNETKADYKEFYLDNETNIGEINVNTCATGSIIFIINTGKVYMLSETKEWKEI